MALKFGSTREGWFRWRRELTPVVAVAGLAADYLSPAELWTILLPLGAVFLLAAMRKWVAAAAVFLLSSWVLIPLAAHTVSSVEDATGGRHMFIVPDAALPTLDEAVFDPCVPGTVGFTLLPVGPGHLINPRWALRDAIVTFADLHNAMLIDRLHSDGFTGLCSDPDAVPR